MSPQRDDLQYDNQQKYNHKGGRLLNSYLLNTSELLCLVAPTTAAANAFPSGGGFS